MRRSVQLYVELDVGEAEIQPEAVHDHVGDQVRLGVQELEPLGDQLVHARLGHHGHCDVAVLDGVVLERDPLGHSQVVEAQAAHHVDDVRG